MTAPNRATLWGETIVEELAASGLEAACVAPGSRSTPLTVALAEHEDVRVFSHLDERSASYFALGRGRRTGEPTAFVCTSGTAAVNAHPAVVEAHESRVPLLVLSADRPAELQDSGANQTIDQTDLYGDAVRWHRTLPEPAPSARRLRALRTAVCRAVSETLGTPPGPVHLNVPLAKPLEPTPVPDDVPDGLSTERRDGVYLETIRGRRTLEDDQLGTVLEVLDGADRGLVVAGPSNCPDGRSEAIAALGRRTGFPILADPLSGVRFGDHVNDTLVCSGYDSYLDCADDWPDPDVVVRFGDSPTSTALREYLRETAPRQFVVDPAGQWREATFSGTDLVAADPVWLARRVAETASGSASDEWRSRFEQAESSYWETVTPVLESETFEGSAVATAVSTLTAPATVYLSNSMPVRDADRFVRADDRDLTLLGNRGASGIDGITSSALGASSATTDPVVLVTGDLAYYHDTNGLLAVERCGVDATVVLVNNDGGGIFHMLPIESFEPPFTDHFKTPHGLDFEPTGDLYGVGFERVSTRADLEAAVEASIESSGTQVIEIEIDAESSHRRRETLQETVRTRLHD